MGDAQERMQDNLGQSDEDLFKEETKPTKLILDPQAPVLLNQCVEAYNVMYSTRSHEVYEEGDEQLPIWVGKLTVLLEEKADIPLHTYSRVVQALQEMNCVIQLQRGSRRELGRWVLVHHPTMEAYEGLLHSAGRKRRVRSSNVQKRITLLQEICAEQQQQIDILLDHCGLQGKGVQIREHFDGETKPSD